jgi:hypothetical protein
VISSDASSFQKVHTNFSINGSRKLKPDELGFAQKLAEKFGVPPSGGDL